VLDEMARILVLAVIVFLGLGAAYLAVLLSRAARREALPTDSPVYRNHLGMARWIERSLGDDMVRVTIPEREQREAQRLLEQFYGERRELGPGS
jgi:hypothetical protein